MQGLENLSLHHIGFAVRSLEASKNEFELLGARFYRRAEDPKRNLAFLFGEISGGGGIELVASLDDKQGSAVSMYTEKGPCAPYHLCYRAKDLEKELARLKGEGIRQVGPLLVNDVYGYMCKGVFLFGLNMGLVELMQEI